MADTSIAKLKLFYYVSSGRGIVTDRDQSDHVCGESKSRHESGKSCIAHTCIQGEWNVEIGALIVFFYSHCTSIYFAAPYCFNFCPVYIRVHLHSGVEVGVWEWGCGSGRSGIEMYDCWFYSHPQRFRR